MDGCAVSHGVARPVRLAVVIPAYKAADTIGAVIRSLPTSVKYVVVVDDGSPDGTAEAARAAGDPRVTVVCHGSTQGVGGAMRTGFALALRTDAEVICKMDADGQMDAGLLPSLVQPVVEQGFDYAKGNRWYDLASLERMPLPRRVGNAVLSFLTKMASGYWNVFDPQNGYIAIRREALERLDLDSLDPSYFFENSMLVQLNVISARVAEVPMPARYRDGRSAMNLTRIVLVFPWKLLRAWVYRVRTRYFGMDLSPIAVLLTAGGLLFGAGACYGAYEWVSHALRQQATPAGTVMLAALPTLLGAQLLLNALLLDIGQTPPGRGIHRVASRRLRGGPVPPSDAA